MREAKQRKGKRGHGEGSIRQLPSGSWQGRLMVGYLADGRPDHRSVTARSRQEVQKQLADLKRRAESGLVGPRERERETLTSFVRRWLDAIGTTVKPATVTRYDIIMRTHVLPALGHHKLSVLKADMIQALYADRRAAGLSPTTVRLIHTTLHKALKDAVEWGYLGYNPAAHAKPPRRADFEARPATPEEVATLLEVPEAGGDRLVSLWALAAFTGARMGELLGLTWEDVSLDRGTISIRRALRGVFGGEPDFDAPKTSRARRVVTLEADAVAALRRHRARQNRERLKLGEAYADYGLVFATALGTALGERNVIRAFKLALRRAGLRDDIRFHDLRHGHITTAAHAGVSIKALSARVGHASVAFTLDRYAHVLEAGDRGVAGAVEQAIRAAGTGSPNDSTTPRVAASQH